MKPTVTRLAAAAFITLLAWLAIASVRPPAPAPADAPANAFSAERAFRDLEAISRETHPIGTEAAVRARELVTSRVRDLGLAPETQEAVALRQGFGGLTAGRVVNVLARMPGNGTEGARKALLLMAHYDSAPGSMGAGDDGSGVAALLETMRALGEGPPLANDVIFLFTDGEEAGLLGAQAFVDEHPWADEVGMVLNFEARGTHGPSLMFETSPGNGRMIATLDEHVAKPIATSYSYEIYKLLPNDTDFSPFRKAGYRGMNFAFIDDESAYHSRQDEATRISRASLQHHGDQALALARAYGDADLTSGWETPNATYFNLLGGFVTYSGSLVMPLALLALLGVVVGMVLGIRRGRASIGGFLAATALELMGAVFLGALGMFLGGWALGGPYDFRVGESWSTDQLVQLAVVFLSLGLSALLYRLYRSRLKAGNLALSGLFLGAVLALIVLSVAPGAGYLFTLPVLFSLPAAYAWLTRDDEDRSSLVGTVLAFLAAAVITLLWAPTLSLLGSALAPVAVALTGFVIFLFVAGFLAPLLPRPARGAASWVLPAVTLAAGLVLLVYGKTAQEHSPENLRPDTLFYSLDTGSGEARWLSFDRAPSEWVRQAAGGELSPQPFPRVMGDGTVPAAPAPVLDLPAPGIEARRTGDGGIEVDVRMPEGTNRAFFSLEPADAVRQLVIDGKSADIEPQPARDGEEAKPLRFLFYAPGETVRLRLTTEGDAPFTVTAASQRFGMDGVPGLELPPRQDDSMRGWGWNADSVVVASELAVSPSELGDEERADEERDGDAGESGEAATAG